MCLAAMREPAALTLRCSCSRLYTQAPPSREPSGDPAWLCLWCPSVICGWCYHVHTAAEHLRPAERATACYGLSGG